MGQLTAMVLEHLHVHAERIILAQAICDLHATVNAVVVADESPDESNHERPWWAGFAVCDMQAQVSWATRQQDEMKKRKNKKGKTHLSYRKKVNDNKNEDSRVGKFDIGT